VNSKKTDDSSKDMSLIEVIKAYPKQLIIAIGMVVGYTVNGFNVIIVYSNNILEQAGMSEKQATLFTFISLSGNLIGLSIGTMLL
jgi:cyanate permease